MKFAVVIPAYDAAATLPAVIAAWRAAIPQPEAIVVIDDGSRDTSAENAERAGASVVRLSENTGRGGARRRGMQETSAPFVLMCDATLIPTGDFIASALAWFAEPKSLKFIQAADHFFAGALDEFEEAIRAIAGNG